MQSKLPVPLPHKCSIGTNFLSGLHMVYIISRCLLVVRGTLTALYMLMYSVSNPVQSMIHV